MTVKAIQTPYKGYLFRSRVEARWAYFFDLLDIKWEYEKEGYELPSGNYLPDFWLPDVNMWAEVKGGVFTKQERQLLRELARQSGYPAFELVGAPGNTWYIAHEPHGDYYQYLFTNYHDYPKEEHRFYAMPADFERFMDTQVAYKAALAARFEHGEQPIMFKIPDEYKWELVREYA